MKLMSATDEPTISVPHVDKSATLAEIATQGIAAVNALSEERNETARLAANLHVHNSHLLAANQTLREEKAHALTQRDELMKFNARLGAYLTQARNLFATINGDLARLNMVIDAMPEPAPVSNNIAVSVDATGLPMEEELELREPQYDKDGLPIDGPPTISADELRAAMEKLNGQGIGQ
jgi:hypothetical protein